MRPLVLYYRWPPASAPRSLAPRDPHSPRSRSRALECHGAFEQFVDETYTPSMAPGVHVRPQPCPVGATPQPSATRPASPAPLIDQPRPSAERARRVQPAFLLLFLSRQYPPPLAAPAARGDEVGARCRRVWTLHTRSPPAHAGRAMTDSALLYGFLA